MKNILVIADPEEHEQQAFAKALSMAKTTVANLHIVIFCNENTTAVNQENGVSKTDLQEMAPHHTKQWWESYLSSQLITMPIAYEIIWEKKIHEWVLEHCQQKNYDLIVKTGHRSESLFYTPTDWQLFRKSPVPVYCVTPEQQNTDNIVLVALDLMATTDTKQQLNRRLLETAFQLSLQTNCELHCCYATEAPVLLTEVELINAPALICESEQKARKQMSILTRDYDVDEQHIHIQQGNPWEVLTNLGDSLKAGCFVLGTQGRTGIAGKLIGNMAEKVIHHAKKDLLVISTDDFSL